MPGPTVPPPLDEGLSVPSEKANRRVKALSCHYQYKANRGACGQTRAVR
jgi:hypothetical protein